MACKLMSINGKLTASQYREYLCDTEDDIALLPKYGVKGNLTNDTSDITSNDSCAIGSKATVITTGDTWILSPSNEWVKQIEKSGGSSNDVSMNNMIIHVTVDDNGDYIADKTYDEIYTAVLSGVIPVCVCGHNLYHLTFAHGLSDVMPMLEASCFSFVSIDMHDNLEANFRRIEIDSMGYVSFVDYILTFGK